MAEEESGQDKPHDASETKIADARKKGDVPQSQELTALTLYAAAALCIIGLSGTVLLAIYTQLAAMLARPGEMGALILSGAEGANPFPRLVLLSSPIFAMLIIGVLSSLILQQSLVMSGKRIQPKLDKISLIANAKKKYGKDGLVEFLKRMVKLCVVTGFAGFYLAKLVGEMAGQVGRSDIYLWSLLRSETLTLLLWMAVATFAIALVDAPFAWWSHRQKLRMSHQEIKDEAKDQEGDPHVKAERRARARAIAQGTMMRDVAKADVVIVNPTHYAVALSWDRAAGGAPVCVAKGVDHIAAAIRARAKEYDVPIHSDPPTARALHATVEIGEMIQPEHYAAVAAAIFVAQGLSKAAPTGD